MEVISQVPFTFKSSLEDHIAQLAITFAFKHLEIKKKI